LPSVDGLGTGGVSTEVLSDKMALIATTTNDPNNYMYPSVANLGSSPVPWDSKTAHLALQQFDATSNTPQGFYSTITYHGQHVRVYTLANEGFGGVHIIQTAHSEQDIEQSLANLRLLLLQGGTLVMLFALVGGWFITWGVISAVRRVTKTAHSISLSRNFSQRVPTRQWFGRDELIELAATFNKMLTNLEELYQHQQRFVADASHALRAPITSIRCNLDLLTKAPDLPPTEAQAALQMVAAVWGWRLCRVLSNSIRGVLRWRVHLERAVHLHYNCQWCKKSNRIHEFGWAEGRQLTCALRFSSFSVYSGYLERVGLGLIINFLFQVLSFHITAGQWREYWQGKHEVEIVICCNTVEAFQAAIVAAMDEDILAFTPLEAADSFHTAPASTQPISRSPVIDMTREKAERTVIAMMRAISRWADKTMAVPALEHLFSRGSLLTHKTWSGILLFTRTRNSSVGFSQWWISSFASIGDMSFEASKAQQQWPRKRKGQDPLWLSNMTVYT